MNLSKRPALLVFAACLASSAVWAQSTATLKGQVADPSGAAIPGASVTVSGPNNAVKVANTDATGDYSIVGLPPGQYTVRVIATGFNLFEKTGVDLASGRTSTLDIPLTVQVEKQEITVADTQQVAIDPDKNAGALVLKGEDLDILPDDPDDLQADLQALAGPSAGPNGGQIFVDGFSNGQLPPKDSIREIRINSNPFSSEYDQPGYGRIEILTKPGTDKFHGMVQMNYGDSMFNSRNPYSLTKPYYNTQNLNANLSGALSKKASFFIDFSRRYLKDAELINGSVLNPASLAITPFNQSVIAPNTRTNISPRIDYQLTSNITLQGRYNWFSQESDNNGVGQFSLLNTGSNNTNKNQNVQLTATWVVNASTVNESRFQWQHSNSNSVGLDPELNISVAQGFTSGSNYPSTYNHQNNYEFQNYTTITHGTHVVKFGARLRGNLEDSFSENNFCNPLATVPNSGVPASACTGQFTFFTITGYQQFLQGVAQGTPLNTLFQEGLGPNQFSAATGQPLLGVNQMDAGVFVQDDWRVKPSITLSTGLRYEGQTNIPDHGDLAPRLGLAWGIGPGQGRNRAPKTVLRAGYGWFYTRFPLGDTLNANRFNGLNQLSYTQTSPHFYPASALEAAGIPASIAQGAGVAIPALSSLSAVSAATYHVDSSFSSPLLMQSAIGIDRALPKNITLSVNYINTRGIHQLQTVNINTPVIGTYIPPSLTTPAQGLYPLGQGAGIYDLYESSGTFKQNQLIFNVSARVNSWFQLQGYYAYGHYNSNVSGAAGSPSNPYNFAQDWGRSAFDIRNRVNINGNLTLPMGIRLSPNISYSSAPPFNITQNLDEYGDSLSNTRPAFVPAGFNGPTCQGPQVAGGPPCIVTVPVYGSFVVNPTPGMKIIPVNYGNAFGQFNINMRISRTWGFGEKTTGNNNQNPRGGQGGPGGPGGFPGGGRGGFGGGGRGGFGGGRGGGFFGGGNSSGQKYTVTLGLVARNLLNTVNPAAPVGNVLAPNFGETLGIANGGFGGASANRRFEINLRLAF